VAIAPPPAAIEQFPVEIDMPSGDVAAENPVESSAVADEAPPTEGVGPVAVTPSTDSNTESATGDTSDVVVAEVAEPELDTRADEAAEAGAVERAEELVEIPHANGTTPHPPHDVGPSPTDEIAPVGAGTGTSEERSP
jgi:hypothetical protein